MVLLFFSLFIVVTQVLFVHASVTLSGLSSGAAFAMQFHVAHSSMINGVGIVAGIPFYCAGGNVLIAEQCMSTPSSISLTSLYTATAYAYATLTIDSPSNIANSKVYVYSGSNDSVVAPGTVVKVQQYYEHYKADIKSVYIYYFDFLLYIPAEHSFVTNSFGSACGILGTPFINNCNYDQAGDILSYLLGKLQSPVSPLSENIIKLAQAQFLPPLITLDFAGMEQFAYLYIPTKCTKGGCQLHVAFHGCEQTLADIGSAFIQSAGYNSWAESNNIIILYPQAADNLLNPKGCWDWWGYTGTAYASKLGVQIVTVKNMIEYVLSKY